MSPLCGSLCPVSPCSLTGRGVRLADVWAPEIATVYGEVFWTSQGNQPLPKEIVERFKGKTMAIVGFVSLTTCRLPPMRELQ